MLEEVRPRLPAYRTLSRSHREIGEEEPDDEASDGLWSPLLSWRYAGRDGTSRKSRRARWPGHHRGYSSAVRVLGAPLSPTKDTSPPPSCATSAAKASAEEGRKSLGVGLQKRVSKYLLPSSRDHEFLHKAELMSSHPNLNGLQVG